MALIKEGTNAPRITLTSTSGQDVTLDELERAIIYFYPKDMTPGCTIEACSFRDRNTEIERAGWKVYGISTDALSTHERFIDKHELPFELLSDEHHEAAEAFGVWNEKSMFGKRFFGTSRVTFAIEHGTVVHVWDQVKPNSHTDEVLEWIHLRPSKP